MNRQPPQNVIKALRKEIGFGCPVPHCGNPYLYWHHFDPPWNEEEHFRPEGMIALCAEHHAKADGGLFTKEQLRAFKVNNKNRIVRGKFDWYRQKILCIIGNNFYYENKVELQYRNTPLVWFNRDENGYFLLNLRMITLSDEERLFLQDNIWQTRGNLLDFVCPPSGKLIHAKYANGDEVKIEFRDSQTLRDLKQRFQGANFDTHHYSFPLTTVDICMKAGGTDYWFTSKDTNLPGVSKLLYCYTAHNPIGFKFDTQPILKISGP